MFHKLEQQEMTCTSVMIDLPAVEYIDLVDGIYRTRGGIVGQRAALKTKTAKTIRSRMVDDINRGAVLPPLVVGILVSGEVYGNSLTNIVSRENFLTFLKSVPQVDLAIIDGMQRTTAIYEALYSLEHNRISDVRVEFWISGDVNNLIYRMLVLNTGQVPWDIARQLEAIYRPLIEKMKDEVGEKISFLSVDESTASRTNLGPSEYTAEGIVELLLIFSSRKRDLNLKDQIAQDFVRLDMIESSSHQSFLQFFQKTIVLLSAFNISVSRFVASHEQRETLRQYANGNALFSGFPAKAGFVSAMAIYLFGKPGFEPAWDEAGAKFDFVEAHLKRFINELNECKSSEQMESLLCFEYLEERITLGKKGVSQVGRYEREYFEKAFTTLFENSFKIKNLQPCWVA